MAQIGIFYLIAQCTTHAQQRLVSLSVADGKKQVTAAQHRGAIFLT